MNRKTCGRHTTYLAGVSLIASLAAGVASTAAQAQTASTAGELEEIVVTAQKRTESLQDVPSSVAALTAEAMEARGVKEFLDVAQTVPSVSFVDSGGAGVRPIVRGVFSSVGSSTVAISLDDAPIEVREQAEGSSDIRLIDIERIEILRGPQGTLYGGSSMGGAIKYVLAQPNLTEVEGKVRGELSTTAHGSESYEAAGAVSVPLITDKVAVRASGFYRKDGGYVDLYDQSPTPALVKKDINEFEIYGGRLAVRLQPTETFSITPSIFYQKTKSDALSSFYSDLGFAKQNPNFREPVTDRLTLATLKAELDLGGAQLTAITAYQDRNNLRVQDQTTLLVDAVGVPPFFGPLRIDATQKQEVFSQEVRLQSTNDDASFGWIVGGFYSHSDLKGVSPIMALGFPGGPANLFTGNNRLTDEQLAGFGEVYYYPVEKLKLTAGVRVSDLEVRNRRSSSGLFAGSPPPAPIDVKVSESPIAPKFNVSYEPNEDNLYYAQVARGFRPGQALAPLPNTCDDELAAIGSDASNALKSDKLWTYEAGAKLQTSDRKARFNIAAYYTDWKDKPESVQLLTCGFSTTANVGRAKIKGLEIESEVAVSDSLTFSASVGYTDADYSKVEDNSGFLKGDPLPFVSKWTASVSGDYRFDVADWAGFARFDFIYRDKVALGSVNEPIVPANPGDPFVPGTTTINAYSESYEYLNLRVGVDKDQWSLSVFMNNVFDTHPVVQASGLTPNSRVQDRITTLRPRTIGVSAGMKF